tara:strand:+ start:479 stop:598 length:120 start_codon:yes stop_codon:yes gene_type:complete
MMYQKLQGKSDAYIQNNGRIHSDYRPIPAFIHPNEESAH